MPNPVLFHALDSDWTLQNVLVAASIACFLIAGVTLTFLLRREGRKRALDAAELETLGRTPDGNPVRMHWVGAKGARVEARADLETLRRAAERGDWPLFWAWPCLMISAGLWIGLLASSTLDLVFICTGGGGGLLFVAFGLFMPWAALYTDIDKPKTPNDPSP